MRISVEVSQYEVSYPSACRMHHSVGLKAAKYHICQNQLVNRPGISEINYGSSEPGSDSTSVTFSQSSGR